MCGHQLFGLINALLVNDPSTSRSNLRITRYAVMPLSSNSGVIGWVKNCDTLHQVRREGDRIEGRSIRGGRRTDEAAPLCSPLYQLIKDYREARKVRLNVEQRLLMGLAPEYEKLPVLHKIQVGATHRRFRTEAPAGKGTDSKDGTLDP
jgi:serine/threonine-protein kinase mTOR